MGDVVVSLRGGPADGRTFDLERVPSDEIEVEVVNSVHFSLTESVGGSSPLLSAHVTRRVERHRYRVFQGNPCVAEWIGRIEE